MITTRGRYALRVMVDLAEHRGAGYIPMKEIADRQGLSVKYMERIMPALTKRGLVEGSHGKGGGYRLSVDPDDCTVLDVLLAAGEDIVPVACLEGGESGCGRAAECRTLPVWKEYYRLTLEYFRGITLSSLAQGDAADNYVI